MSGHTSVPIITAGHRTNVRLFTGNVRPRVTWPDKNVRAPVVGESVVVERRRAGARARRRKQSDRLRKQRLRNGREHDREH